MPWFLYCVVGVVVVVVDDDVVLAVVVVAAVAVVVVVDDVVAAVAVVVVVVVSVAVVVVHSFIHYGDNQPVVQKNTQAYTITRINILQQARLRKFVWHSTQQQVITLIQTFQEAIEVIIVAIDPEDNEDVDAMLYV